MTFRRIRAMCVACRVPLEQVTGDGYELECPACSAQLISIGDLTALFAEAQPSRELALVVHNDGSQRHDCPVCLDRMSVSWVEFLRLETCEVHGAWLGAGALARLLAYRVQRQGLPSFRRRQKT